MAKLNSFPGLFEILKSAINNKKIKRESKREPCAESRVRIGAAFLNSQNDFVLN